MARDLAGRGAHAPTADRARAALAAGLPRRLGRFGTATGDELLLRWIERPTRKAHPARHCFRGSGHEVEPLPAWRDEAGRRWSRFLARSPEGTVLEVRELVVTGDPVSGGFRLDGPHFPDVGAWWWQSGPLGSAGAGPWWAITWALDPTNDRAPGALGGMPASGDSPAETPTLDPPPRRAAGGDSGAGTPPRASGPVSTPPT